MNEIIRQSISREHLTILNPEFKLGYLIPLTLDLGMKLYRSFDCGSVPRLRTDGSGTSAGL